MLKKTFWRWLICAVAIGLWLQPKTLLAQQSMGTLTGTVLNASTKQPIPDVVVTATSPSLQGEQLVVTDSSGLYRIPFLPPGTYTLRLDKEQFRPFSRDKIQLRADATLRIDALLLPEAITGEEVTVVARAPSIDIGTTSTGQNISQEFTRRIP